MTAAPSPYSLASLNDVKAWLGNSGASAGDDDLQRLISAASRFVLAYLSRGNILSAQYTDRMDGAGFSQSRVLLPRWPVTSLVNFSVDNVVVPLATAPGPNLPLPNGALLQPWDGIPPGNYQAVDLYGWCLPRGRQNIVVTYVAGYLIANEPVTLANPIATVTTANLLQPYGKWAADAGVTLANGTPLAKVSGAPAAGQYALAQDPASLVGTYTFNAAQAGASILVSYSFVPYDLAQAVIELTAARATDRTHIGQVSKTLGGQETVAYSQKDIPDPMRLMLANYKSTVPM